MIKPKLLSGDNPQIAKGYGDGPVRDYIAAIPGWKQSAAQQLDELIVATVPGVQKAVKWNSPFYGLESGMWFMGFHCFSKYLKVTFFQGASLEPLPPEGSKTPEVRYYHITEAGLDSDALVNWIRQAAALPGERV